MDNKYISNVSYNGNVLYIKDAEAREVMLTVSDKGASNGVATLNSNGHVPSAQLDSASTSICQDIVDELE